MDLYYIIATVFAIVSLCIAFNGLRGRENPEIIGGLGCLSLAAALAILRYFECYTIIAIAFIPIGLVATTLSTAWWTFTKEQEKKDYISPICCLIGGLICYWAFAEAFHRGDHHFLFLVSTIILTLIHFGSTFYGFFHKMRYTSAISTVFMIWIILYYWKAVSFINISILLVWTLFAIAICTSLMVVWRIGWGEPEKET